MMSVDVIGDIRRAYFEQRLPIKEIVRTLRVSRATVRKVVRSHKTAFQKYERGVQPTPKLGAWSGRFYPRSLRRRPSFRGENADRRHAPVRRAARPRLRVAHA